MKMVKKSVDQDFALEAVTESHRRGFWKMFMLMVGFTFFSASMLAGGTLGQGLTFSQFIVTVLIGNLLLGAYTGVLSYIASKTGLSTHLLTRYSFGKQGSYLPSFLLSITQIGWFGVGVMMFALPFQKVTGLDIWPIIIVSGLLMTATAYFGIKALTALSFIAVPAIAILGSVTSTRAVGSMGGLEELMAYQPVETLGIAAAISVCLGSFISGGTLTPDFARFAKSKKIAVSTTLMAFFLGNSLMFLFGAIGTISTGQADISEVMFTQGLIIPALIILGLNIWTTNDNSLYASGLGFSNITKLPKKMLVIINGIIGTLLAMWLYNNFMSWLGFLNMTLPPIGAILIVDYFVRSKGSYEVFQNRTFSSVRIQAIAAWAIGVLCAVFIPGISPLNSLLGATVSYIILDKILEKNREQMMKKAG
ncbi:cytosine permease [Alkalicoccobacillus porphyridii]|uniref:Cytosine permease n=2 Tax=Alkalicoccobacillus porphyridii TaxID=2597270 RepID=A0A554A1Q6_9BACI|nr:cytosine permease [Alkalicoccobacillus porphyridii]